MKINAVTSEIMSEIDRRAQEEFGIAQEFLMENAGKSVADTIITDSTNITNEKVLMFCGKGNNGGDGFVAARYLSEAGVDNISLYVTDIDHIKKGSTFDNYVKIKEKGLDIRPLNHFEIMSKEMLGITVLVDSIFGTGFKGDLPEEIGLIWEYFKVFDIKRYAVDIPSGLNGSTGEAANSCFIAKKTITFGLSKKGFYVNDGPQVCGEIIVKDIGFPQELLSQYG